MDELHDYGLIRFSKKTGKVDTTMTALGRGVIQLWALQNTTASKASIIVDITEHRPFAEYVGNASGFPCICKEPTKMQFNIPEQLYGEFTKERDSGRAESKGPIR